jgi:hypothetical protein
MDITDSGKFVPGGENKAEKCGHDHWVHDTLHWLKQLPSRKGENDKAIQYLDADERSTDLGDPTLYADYGVVTQKSVDAGIRSGSCTGRRLEEAEDGESSLNDADKFNDSGTEERVGHCALGVRDCRCWGYH